MKLNNIELISFAEQANEVTFVLDCDLATALALDGQTLTITAGERDYKVFSGYSVLSVGVQGDYTAMRAYRKLDDATAQAINGLDAYAASLGARVIDTEAAIGALCSAFATEGE